MTRQDDRAFPVVDAIIPVYGERSEALAATLSACVKQTRSLSTIFVVDDGSPEPVSLPDWAQSFPQIRLLRLSLNQGISAARNAAIVDSNATFLACINTEVLPDPDWLDTCLSYLLNNPRVGASYTRTDPQGPHGILTRWRMRFQEPGYPGQSGATEFAHGHAVVFRKEAVDAVGGYDASYRRRHEDWDICQRMRKLGWESHYVAQSRAISIQHDSLHSLAVKQLRDSDWFSPGQDSLLRLYLHLTKWTFIRAGRNVLKARLHFVPVDVAIWASALWIATTHALRSYKTNSGSET